jgi:hypothetical protein
LFPPRAHSLSFPLFFSVRVEGTVRLESAGPGRTRQRFRGTARVSLPTVGPLVEKLIVSTITRSYARLPDIVHQWTQARAASSDTRKKERKKGKSVFCDALAKEKDAALTRAQQRNAYRISAGARRVAEGAPPRRGGGGGVAGWRARGARERCGNAVATARRGARRRGGGRRAAAAARGGGGVSGCIWAATSSAQCTRHAPEMCALSDAEEE